MKLLMSGPEHEDERETKFLLIAAENNALRTSYVKAKTDNLWENSRSRRCGNSQPDNKQMQQTGTKWIIECTRLGGKGD